MTSRPDYYEQAQVPDMERRLSEMVVIGIVDKTDYSDAAAPRVRVKVGKELTDWLPWSSGSAGGNTDWEPLDEGEQVIMVAPGGDRKQAVILGSINQTKHQTPSKDPDESARRWKDGSQQTYNRKKHEWLLKLHNQGAFKIEVGETIFRIVNGELSVITKTANLTASDSINCATPVLNVSGKIVAGGDVVGGGVSLIDHLHIKVMPGPLVSGPPLGGGINTGGISGGGAPGSESDGGGPWGGPSDINTPSLPGDPDIAGTFGNGIANDASGIFRAAVQTRVPYLGTPNIEGAGIPEMNFGYTFKDMPAQPLKITEDVFKERVRQTGVGFFDGGLYQAVVSEVDETTGKWKDDVIDMMAVGDRAMARSSSPVGPVGTYSGPIPDGIQQFAQPGPFDVYMSRDGVAYAKYCDWGYVVHITNATQFGERPIFWKLTDEEMAEHFTPKDDQ